LQAVALGAAVQAGILEGSVPDLMVMDIWQVWCLTTAEWPRSMRRAAALCVTSALLGECVSWILAGVVCPEVVDPAPAWVDAAQASLMRAFAKKRIKEEGAAAEDELADDGLGGEEAAEDDFGPEDLEGLAASGADS
jgi:hypothetical protein